MNKQTPDEFAQTLRKYTEKLPKPIGIGKMKSVFCLMVDGIMAVGLYAAAIIATALTIVLVVSAAFEILRWLYPTKF